MITHKKIQFELDASDQDFEGENYHSMVGTDRKIFEATKHLIAEANHLEFVRELREKLQP